MLVDLDRPHGLGEHDGARDDLEGAVGGAVVLSEAMRAFDVNELDVSPWALREGLILRRLDRMT